MHPTADTTAVKFLGGAARRVMRALDCWGDLKTSLGECAGAAGGETF
jgi:hypothetical protein